MKKNVEKVLKLCPDDAEVCDELRKKKSFLYVYLCMYAYVYFCIYAEAYMSKCICVCVYMCVHVYICPAQDGRFGV